MRPGKELAVKIGKEKKDLLTVDRLLDILTTNR